MGWQLAERQEWLLDLGWAVGLRVTTCAAMAGVSVERAWHDWSRCTGLPTPDDPAPSEIAARALEVQRGWTDAVRELAKRGVTDRPQSSVVAYRVEARREERRRSDARRKGAGDGATDRSGAGAINHDSRAVTSG